MLLSLQKDTIYTIQGTFPVQFRNGCVGLVHLRLPDLLVLRTPFSGTVGTRREGTKEDGVVYAAADWGALMGQGHKTQLSIMLVAQLYENSVGVNSNWNHNKSTFTFSLSPNHNFG